jgi:predicted transposase YdaD
MQESSTYQHILQLGEQKGRQEGRQEGQVCVLLRQGRRRFGPPTAADEAALLAITDLDRLDRLTDAVLTAASWHELLATL